MTKLTIGAVRAILADVKFNAWTFRISFDGDRMMLQVRDENGVCNVTGEPMPWGGRKWPLSPFMTKSEVVNSAFKAILTAVEHETREQFLYKGQAIFGPHLDVDKLFAVVRDGAEDVREEPAQANPCKEIDWNRTKAFAEEKLDPHTARAKRDGITRAEAKRRNYLEVYAVRETTLRDNLLAEAESKAPRSLPDWSDLLEAEIRLMHSGPAPYGLDL